MDNLARSVEGVTIPLEPIEQESLCPYRGLRPFREEDAAIFHGREAFSQRLLEAILDRNLVAVVGTSGSGKSSVVQAGVIHQLRSHHPPDSTWDAISFVPGAHPFDHLAASLMPLLEPELDEIELLAKAKKLGNLLAEKEVTIESVIDRVLKISGGTDRLLLVADQFEEIFTQTSNSDRQAFLDALLQALDRSLPLTVVITVRGSFYDNLISASRDLSDRLEQAVINLGLMTQNELRRAVVEPAKRVGLTFEPGLIKRILDDVGNEPGNLPLLEFALSELWSRRQGKLMTHHAYEDIGGVSGAIAQRADAVFMALPTAQQKLAHRILTRLVTVSEQVEITHATRKRTKLSELGEECQEVLKVMTDARLLVVGRLGVDGEKTAEVAHEALIRHWERLRGWLDEDREFLLWRRRLLAALSEWERTGRDRGTLLRGMPLREAERWHNERVSDLNTQEHEFITKSSKRDQRERTRRERRRKFVLFSSLGSAVIFLALASFALIESLEAFSRELSAAARAQLSVDPELSLLLAIHAVNIKATSEATNILRQSFIESHVRLTIKEDSIINDAVFSPEKSGRIKRPHVVTVSNDNIARVWDISKGWPLLSLKLTGHNAPITGVAFNASGSLIVTSSEDKTARIWDAATGQVRSVLLGHTDMVNSASFSNNEIFTVTSSNDATIRIWETKTGRLLRTFRHDEPLTSAAFSPDSGLIITSSIDNSAQVWSTKTGKQIDILRGHQAPLSAAIFSPDGDTIVTASADNTARIWKMLDSTWFCEKILTGHSDSLNSIVFSSDGKKMVTASDDRTSRVWDTQTWRSLSELRGHTDVITHAAFNSDGSRVITSSRDTTARIWTSESQKTQHALHGHSGTVNSAKFSKNGSKVITAGSDNTARIWDPVSGQELHNLKGHTDSVQTASFGPDENIMVTSSDDNTARIWRIDPNKSPAHPEELVLEGHTDDVRMATFSPDGNFVITASNDKTARIWDTETGRSIAVLGASSSRPPKLPGKFIRRKTSFSNDKVFVAFIDDDKPVHVWDTTTGQHLAELKGHDQAVTDAVFSPNGERLITTSLDSTARIWELATGKFLPQQLQHDNWVIAAAFSPDGQLVATGSTDHTARIWETSSGKLLRSILHKQSVTGVTFFAANKTLLTTIEDNTSYIWDLESGEKIRHIPGNNQDNPNGHRKRIYSARFSPDGMFVVTASADHTARVWAAHTGQFIVALKGHTQKVIDARFSPDGTSIVTASNDETARVWDARSGQLQHLLKGHSEELTGAIFSADGKSIITSSKDYTAKVWDTETGQQLSELRGHRDWVNTAEFSPNGQLAVTASRDGTALVWGHLQNGKWGITSHLFGHNFDVRAHFSGDGRSVVTAGRDGTARVWQLNASTPPQNDQESTDIPSIADCEICEPSLEDICTLATKRAAHAISELHQLVNNKFLRTHEFRYKIISWMGQLWGRQCEPPTEYNLPKSVDSGN